ncbi:MMPL family transporter [Streptomyces sp. NPDC056309]|uniref:MMPL family transporter n=1 Tax=unclassified Streptomyces TaxID=2593676 RepID=UPI0035E1E19B
MVLLVAVGFASTKATAPPDENGSMPGIEAQEAYELLEQRFPSSSHTAESTSTRIVFVAPEGEKVTAAENRAVIEKLVKDAGEVRQVAGVVSPFEAKTVSDDASTAFATVTLDAAAADVTDSTKEQLKETVAEARDAGLTVDRPPGHRGWDQAEAATRGRPLSSPRPAQNRSARPRRLFEIPRRSLHSETITELARQDLSS